MCSRPVNARNAEVLRRPATPALQRKDRQFVEQPLDEPGLTDPLRQRAVLFARIRHGCKSSPCDASQ
jgi:hypothetical protein